uniref:Odorant receptor n=1 Tax=Lobesia botrana TaxID=209534 RepID=A0A345BEX6_9NEOP|nr:odorant receptors OR58.2 [Lobesia botrana]
MPKVTNKSPTMVLTTYQKNETRKFLNLICKIIYFSCGKNFWYDDMDYPRIFMAIHNTLSNLLEVIVIAFNMGEWGAFLTQHHLNEKQTNDMCLFAFSHVLLYSVYVTVLYYKQDLRKLVYTFGVTLKEVCNDEMTERMMIKTAGRYLTGLVFLCSSTLVFFGIGSGLQSITTNATFTTVIPTWPDTEDRRTIAGIARLLYYLVWWILMVRTVSVYLIILTLTICLAHQFTILCKYFESLNNIFEGTGSQAEKERRYEEAFKVGIQMHSTTLWCAKKTQETCGLAFSAQVIMSVSVLVMLMIQTMSIERTLRDMLPIGFMAASVLVAAGVFMWNAGDVTIEASRLPAAMFYSGWYNCQRDSSVRMRKLVTISITQAQKRVLIKGLGIIELSYESYVKIVKSS